MKQLDFIAMRERAEAKLKAAQAALDGCDSDIKQCETAGFMATAKALRVGRKRLEANFVAAKIVFEELSRVKAK